MTAITLEMAQRSDRRHIDSMQNSVGTAVVDRWFDDKIRDCQRRRKAAILRATHLMEAV